MVIVYLYRLFATDSADFQILKLQPLDTLLPYVCEPACIIIRPNVYLLQLLSVNFFGVISCGGVMIKLSVCGFSKIIAIPCDSFRVFTS